MNSKYYLSDLELASLLASRVCHDVIGPVGAIVNGLEVLDEENDEEMREIAMELVRKSAESASVKLKFSRLAFGASGSAGMEIDLSEAGEISVEFATSPRVNLEWNCPHQTRPKDHVKLLMNMVLIGISTIPRGGMIKVSATEDRENPHYEVRCSGRGAKFPEKSGVLMRAEVRADEIDARDVQVYYTGLVARMIGLELSTQIYDDEAVFTANVALLETRTEPIRASEF
jgi:histidine phosphotransferase ChpT